VVDFDVGVILLSENGNLALSIVMQLLMNEVQDQDLVLINLLPKVISTPFVRR